MSLQGISGRSGDSLQSIPVPPPEADDFLLMNQGCSQARDRILSRFYDELKVIAHGLLRRQHRTPSLHTGDLQPEHYASL